MFAGALPPASFVAVNSPLHALPFDVETAHAFNTSAMVSISGAGELPFAANVGPGLVPALMSASACAVVTAFPRPTALVELAPIFPPIERNCESAYDAATVVTSFTTIWADAALWLH